jgi:predicted acylesterase/phospholipase RssA
MESLSQNNMPTLGIALSGTGSRLTFYIGFLEELKKNQIQIDYISASSSASIVAASFACGTLPKLKRIIFNIKSKNDLKNLLIKGKFRGGLYCLDKFETISRNVLTKGSNFEDVRPLMGFVAVDIDSKKQIVLSMGDIAHAMRISCTLPGVFEPVEWGGRILIDGGLLNVIPVDVLKEAGMDVTVGVNARGNIHIFSEAQMILRKIFNLTKRTLLIDRLEKAWEYLSSEKEAEDIKPGIFSVLGKSLDIAIEAHKQDHSKFFDCDLMIDLEMKKYSLKTFAKSNKELYELGRKTAKDYAPRIKELIKSKTASTKY